MPRGHFLPNYAMQSFREALYKNYVIVFVMPILFAILHAVMSVYEIVSKDLLSWFHIGYVLVKIKNSRPVIAKTAMSLLASQRQQE